VRCLPWQRRDTSLGEQLPGIINPKGGSDGPRVFLISKVEVGCWPIEAAEVLRDVPLYGDQNILGISVYLGTLRARSNTLMGPHFCADIHGVAVLLEGFRLVIPHFGGAVRRV
jgi:hypothetical protein